MRVWGSVLEAQLQELRVSCARCGARLDRPFRPHGSTWRDPAFGRIVIRTHHLYHKEATT